MALKIDNEIVHTTATETIMQNVEAFTAGTNGAITLSTEMISGDMLEYSMLAEIANLVGSRDIAVGTAAAVKTIDSRDENTIKVYWGTGAIEFKLVDAKRYGSDSAGFSAAIGEQIGKAIVQYALNLGISAVRASIETQATLVTGDGTGVVTHTLLNSGLKPFGDARESIVAFVMNGATFTDLIGSALGSGGADVAYGAIYSGQTGTLNRPVFVTDSAGLSMTARTEVLETQTFDFAAALNPLALGETITITIDGQAFTVTGTAALESGATLAALFNGLTAGNYTATTAGTLVTITQKATFGAPIAQGAVTGSNANATTTAGQVVAATTTEGVTAGTARTAVLGLTRDAVRIIESEAREFVSELVSGRENLVWRIQAEGSFALNVKGYSWKKASGTNPSMATVGTKANWEKKATDIKSTAGVIICVK